MASLLLVFIMVSLTVSDGDVHTDTKFKVNFNKLVKIPISVENTSSKQNLEAPSITPKCNVTITGPWAKRFNLTAEPIPPHTDEMLKIHVDFYGFGDVWYITAKGNLTKKGAPHGYSFDLNFCDYKEKLCPIRKGETRHMDESVFLPSAYVDKLIPVDHDVPEPVDLSPRDHVLENCKAMIVGNRRLAVRRPFRFDTPFGVYSAFVELTDQDDKLCLVVNIRECPVV